MNSIVSVNGGGGGEKKRVPAHGTATEAEGNSGAGPTGLEHSLDTFVVENVPAM